METTLKDQEIYCKQDVADSFYLVKEGKVKIIQRSDNGKEVILAILGPGEIFGELAITDKATRDEVAVAAEDSLVCMFKASDFLRLMEASPQLTLQITKTIGQRLEKVQRRLEQLMFRTAEERVRDFLRDLAQESGYAIANNPEEIAVPMQLTHEDVGKLTATSRQTVTTVLNTLEKAGILTYNRHRIYIKCFSLL
ncbi:Crp/Fnr family transcriptional regulator [Pontibacter sp. FD36]|uniref:Crp/Fnr family transcriptional regulator n=1 Tax=Pontibacter sp. FD36 TaxID=2789860 RepID=UPI0018AA4CB9|nr:Crp/Fnr family transcriptional regulator [Pontibacter sp. FD36]MBF8965483.1 Crp/Fnr family transcriptional regulator [Pontibacter sp. FD36]